MAKYKMINCPKCKGTGLYHRHTPYTENGKPICFRCKGTGEIQAKVTKPALNRQCKWQIVGAYSEWPNQQISEIEIPF